MYRWGAAAPEVRQDLGVPDDRAVSLADFDRYVQEHGTREQDYPAAFALSTAPLIEGDDL